MRVVAYCVLLLLAGSACAQGPTVYVTSADRTRLLDAQPMRSADGQGEVIRVDRTRRFQTMDGFGFALTGGSAELLMKMSPEARSALLRELFGPDGIGVSYVRLSIGASDMNSRVFSYDDLPDGQTDPKLRHFSLAEDLTNVVPVMQEVEKIRPGIAVLGSPWSAPVWMKTNGKVKAGSLRPEFYRAYAQYLVKYLKAMQARGVAVTAITIQNEPLNPKNTPSMVMQPEEQAAFLRDALGPALEKARLKTKVVLYDHNLDQPDYPLTVMADEQAARFADGAGFHLYAGSVDKMTEVHEKFPEKNVYFTEQMVVDRPGASGLAIARPVARILIGATRNWSRNVLLWNLAADPQFGPHTNDGGCPICEGAVTLDGDKVTRNLAYYALAQVAKFVPPGSVRIDSTELEGVPTVAFTTPQRKTVVVLANTSAQERAVVLQDGVSSFAVTVPAGGASTAVW